MGWSFSQCILILKNIRNEVETANTWSPSMTIKKTNIPSGFFNYDYDVFNQNPIT